MEEEKLRDILKDLLETDCGFLFIEELLEKLGAFEKGCNFENVYLSSVEFDLISPFPVIKQDIITRVSDNKA